MSIINFTSGINEIEQKQSLSEWASEYVRKWELSRENLANCEHFRSLTRRQKDAIRYQLRRNPSPQNITVKKARIRTPAQNTSKSPSISPWRLLLSFWISAFLLIDIAQIYIAKGLSPLVAWQTAILVEICMFAASLSKERRIRKIAYALLSYNLALFALSEIAEVIKTQKENSIIEINVKEKQNLKDELTKRIQKTSTFRENSYSQMSEWVKQGYLSSASRALRNISTSLNDHEDRDLVQARRIDQELSQFKEQRKNVFYLGIVAVLYFLLRSILQLFSIYLLKGCNPKEPVSCK